jgi:hypothetical protein
LFILATGPKARIAEDEPPLEAGVWCYDDTEIVTEVVAPKLLDALRPLPAIALLTRP